MTQLSEEIAAIEREIAYRRRVYPRLVANGKMTEIAAQRETRTMERVLARLRQLPDPERLL